MSISASVGGGGGTNFVGAYNHTLISVGHFQLHSGETSKVLIDCSYFSSYDIANMAKLLKESLGVGFRAVIGIPRGGHRLAAAMKPFATNSVDDPILLCDDVYTTGTSLNEYADFLKGEVVAAVLVSRTAHYPDWVHPFFVVPFTLP